MKLERTRNAARNVVFDGTMEIVNMLFPFQVDSVFSESGGAWRGQRYGVQHVQADC